MGKGRKKHPNENRNKQRVINRNTKDLTPTEGPEDKSEQKDKYLNAPKPKVRTEESNWTKVINFLQPWGSILTIFVTFTGFIIWAANLSFDIEKAKDDISKSKISIEKNEKSIEKNEDSISNLNIGRASTEKDIEYLNKNDQRIELKLTSLDKSINDLRYSKSAAIVEVEKTNKVKKSVP